MCNCFNKERQMIAYFNWKVKFYTVAGNCSMCNISFPTWYKPVHVEMKTFEGGRSSGTSVHRQTNPTFLQGTGVCTNEHLQGPGCRKHVVVRPSTPQLSSRFQTMGHLMCRTLWGHPMTVSSLISAFGSPLFLG